MALAVSELDLPDTDGIAALKPRPAAKRSNSPPEVPKRAVAAAANRERLPEIVMRDLRDMMLAPGSVLGSISRQEQHRAANLNSV
jgi:hypothetical protein